MQMLHRSLGVNVDITLIERLRKWAETRPDDLAYSMLNGRGDVTATCTYGELMRKVRAVQKALGAVDFGTPVVLVYAPGLEFLTVFLGCLAAGVVAVPAPRPDAYTLKQTVERLNGIIADSGSPFVLCEDAELGKAWALSVPCLSVRNLAGADGGGEGRRAPTSGDAAYLQYSSGSTAAPKGVVITHGNLVSNVEVTRGDADYGPHSRSLAWVPHFHDYGLVNGLLCPLWCGIPNFVLPPVALLRSPLTWLKSISDYRITHSGGPNFAFQHCLDRIPDTEVALLDLSSWRCAHSGAEPIRAETMKAFAEKFAPAGFERDNLKPSYGMAEVTLLASIRRADQPYETFRSNRDGTVFEAVGCGAAVSGMTVLIVDPHTRQPLEEGRVGEIWIDAANPSVSPGYWRRDELNEEIFRARAIGRAERFLRTGDLGAFRNGHLVIEGRLKDVLVRAGRKIHPTDIEWAAQRAHAGLKKDAGAAFQIDDGTTERIVLVQEIDKRYRGHDWEAVADAVTAAISASLAITLDELLLVGGSSVPKTSSGKIRRSACRDAFLAGQLPVLHRVCRDRAPVAEADIALAGGQGALGTLMDFAARRGGKHPAPESTLLVLGASSIDAVFLQQQIAGALGVELPISDLLTKSLRELADIVDAAERPASRRGEAAPPPETLTPLQHAYWLGRDISFPLGGVGCHYYVEYDAGEALDPQRLNAALNALVARHRALRSIVDGDGSMREVHPVPSISVWETDAIEARATLSHKCYETDQWPLFTVALSNRRRLHLSFDLLIADASSLHILLRELEALYRGKSLPAPADAPPLAYPRGAWEAARAWWLERAPSLPSSPALPLASAPDSVGVPAFSRRQRIVASGPWLALKEIARRQCLTPSQLVMTAFAAVLARWSAEPRFILNVTLMNRMPANESAVGDFTSNLLLDFDFSALKDAATVFAETRGRFLETLDHLAFSGVEVLGDETVRARRANAGLETPVVFTSLLGLDGDFVNRAGAFGARGFAVSQTPQVYMDVQVFEADGALHCSADCVEELFPEGLPETMLEALTGLLVSLADEARWRMPLAVELPAEQQRRLRAYNDTARAYPSGLLHQPFEAALARSPESTALIAADVSFTYAALARRVAAIAGQLASAGVRAGDNVALLMEKSWRQVVAELAVSSLGGVFVPLSPSWPDMRIREVLDVVAPRLVCVDSRADRGCALPEGVVPVVVDGEGGEDYARRTVDRRPSDAAYIIFTSGSTGIPKGVVISHAGALNTLHDVNARFAVGAQDVVLGLSEPTFDLSIYDVFGSFAAGAALALPESGMGLEPAALSAFACDARVTLWNSVPALMGIMVDYLESETAAARAPLRLAMLSGDWVPCDLPARIATVFPGGGTISMGGATEASVWSIYCDANARRPGWTSIPYGVPLANQTIHVLDSRLEACPDWVEGELFIGGDGVAMAYFNAPALSSAAFFDHPRTGERLYRTGDLGRMRPDGMVEFLGRRDGRIKLNGYRIELGELETLLRRADGVQDAAAVVSDGLLHAFLRMDSEPDLHAVRTYLSQYLPDYMLPAAVHRIDALPLTANGKVDRGRLRVPRQREHAEVAPQTPLQAQLAETVGEILGHPVTCVRKGFIANGGNSVQAARLVTALRRRFEVGVPIRAVLNDGSVGDLEAMLMLHGYQAPHAVPSPALESGEAIEVIEI